MVGESNSELSVWGDLIIIFISCNGICNNMKSTTLMSFSVELHDN